MIGGQPPLAQPLLIPFQVTAIPCSHLQPHHWIVDRRAAYRLTRQFTKSDNAADHRTHTRWPGLCHRPGNSVSVRYHQLHPAPFSLTAPTNRSLVMVHVNSGLKVDTFIGFELDTFASLGVISLSPLRC